MPPELFDGATFNAEHDEARLLGQLVRVRTLMLDGVWRTLSEISVATGAPEASISARLRDLRKTKFGSYVVESQPRGERAAGLWEYRVLPPTEDGLPAPSECDNRLTQAEIEAGLVSLRRLVVMAQDAGIEVDEHVIRLGCYLRARSKKERAASPVG